MDMQHLLMSVRQRPFLMEPGQFIGIAATGPFIVTYQTPPALDVLSNPVTSRPAVLRCMTAATPLTPAPMTATVRILSFSAMVG